MFYEEKTLRETKDRGRKRRKWIKKRRERKKERNRKGYRDRMIERWREGKRERRTSEMQTNTGKFGREKNTDTIIYLKKKNKTKTK